MDKQLVVVAGNEKGKVFPLPASGLFTIGRSNGTDTKLTDLRVSRAHCQVQIAGTQVKLVDTQSATGTFINDQRIDSERELRPGDVIRVGDTMLRLDGDDVSEAATVSGAPVPEAATLAGTVVNGPVSAPVAVPLGELVGTALGHYTISSFLAAGKTSVLFKAHDNREDRVVALKVLRPEACKNEGAMQSLTRRLHGVLALRDPNLVSLYDLGRDRSYCWFALELVHGETLTQVMSRLGLAGMLDWQLVLRWGLQLAKGLQHLHQQQIVHGSVMPSHVWVTTADKAAKLGGLVEARSFESGKDKPGARPDQWLGEVAYRAPEQLRGDLYGDPRTDSYSLGATLYTLLTGRPPFDGATPVETLAKVLQFEAAPPHPSDFQFSLPPRLEQVILRMLAKRPEDRYADLGQVVADFEGIAKGQTLQAKGRPTQMSSAEDTVAITCGSCGQKLRPRRKFVGSQVKCPTCRKLLVVPEEPGIVQPVTVPETKAPTPTEAVMPRQPINVELWGKRLTWPAHWTLPSQVVITPSMIAVATAVLFFAGLMFFVLAIWLTAGQKASAPRSEPDRKAISSTLTPEPAVRSYPGDKRN